MKGAPVGLGAYFAYQVGIFGPQLFGAYAKPLAVYYGMCTFYFIVFFTIYAFFSGGLLGVKVFWKNNITPSFTAIGTCSSIATIPANLEGATQMKIPAYIRNLVIPLGAPLHKDGSSMSSIVKIAVIFAIFGKDFTDPFTILTAIGITIIVSVVEGGIPNGGYIGEILAITIYGFPMEQALPAAMIIGTLVDPIATLLNANGDLISAMMVTRIIEGKIGFCDKMKSIKIKLNIMKKISLGLLTLLGFMTYAQNGIQQSEVTRIETQLASDAMEGRALFTPGIEKHQLL